MGLAIGFGTGLGITSASYKGGAVPLVINKALLSQAPFTTIISDGKAGTDTPILVIGDSMPFGYGADAVQASMRPKGLSKRLADKMVLGGVKAVGAGFLGNGKLHGVGSESAAYDNRLTGASTWRTGVSSLGGASFFAQFSNSDPLPTFTPDEAVNTIRTYYRRAGGAGTFSYSIDGATAVNVNTNGTAGLQIVTNSGLPLTSHAIALASVSGDVRIYGFDAYDSSKLGLRFINAANIGGGLGDYTANVNDYDPLKVASALAPRAVILMIGANHWNAGLSLSTFSTQLQILIDFFANVCPTILVSDIPTNPIGSGTRASLAAQQTFVDEMVSKAVANNLVMFDQWRAYGGLGASFDSRWLSDHLHPSPTGNDFIASAISSGLLLSA